MDKKPVSEADKIQDTSYYLDTTSDQKRLGVIKSIDDDKPFDHGAHKSEYDKIAEFVINYVQKEMRQTYCLQEVAFPSDSDLEQKYHSMPRCPIFMTSNFLPGNKDANTKEGRKALVLIQGTGAVRAGIWARSVCINDSMEKGSMLPFLEIARANNIDVLVMNPNYNCDPKTGVTCPYSQSMQDHAVNVWGRYVADSGFMQVDVVAHSAGGGCLSAIQTTHEKTFYNQVRKIAYTDSWVIDSAQLTERQQKFMFENAKHYQSSDEPVGTIIAADFQKVTCPVVSAGHPRHEYTTGACQEEIWTQFGWLKAPAEEGKSAEVEK